MENLCTKRELIFYETILELGALASFSVSRLSSSNSLEICSMSWALVS